MKTGGTGDGQNHLKIIVNHLKDTDQPHPNVLVQEEIIQEAHQNQKNMMIRARMTKENPGD